MKKLNNNYQPNQRYGKLTLLERCGGHSGNCKTLWYCKCDCGNFVETSEARLKQGNKSCGCIKSNQLHDISGRKFGKLTALHIEYNEDNIKCWKCKCECGNTKLITKSALTAGIRSCGCYASEKYDDISGEETEYFVIIKNIGTKKIRTQNRRHYLCICKACRKEKEIPVYMIKGNGYKSCGCVQEKIDSGSTGGAGAAMMRNNYIRGAKKRNLDFDLSKEEFFRLTQENCFYCGMAPSQAVYRTFKYTLAYNGIDRKNNDIGYNVDNCVACCADCNQMKCNIPIDEFFRKIKKIYNFNNLSEIDISENENYVHRYMQNKTDRKDYLQKTIDKRKCSNHLSGENK